VDWNDDDQLPQIDGQPLKKALSGPDLVVGVLAFHYALLAMSVDPPNPNNNHPKLLIIDEPEQQKMGKERYRQILGLFADLGLKFNQTVQIIIATDNRDIPDHLAEYALEL
jgi:hypothetical protein